MNREECARMLSEAVPDGKTILEEHMNVYEEILLHILAGDLITEPLIELLQWNKGADRIGLYCNMIEQMWRMGDSDVVNVVDVTILERLSDDVNVWNQFGTYLSNEFKEYINKEAIPNNVMMPRHFLEYT